LGKFWRVLQSKMLVYFMTFGTILRALRILYPHLVFCGNLVYFTPFWCVVQGYQIFPASWYQNRKNVPN
jgi:hypothetical protein